MSEAFEITDEEQSYEQYGLNDNPFPYSPVPADDPEIFCGQDHVIEKVSSTVSTVLSTGRSRHLVVTGKYGNGKSHTLKYTRSLIRDREDVIVGYVAQPGEGFLDIYHEFMYDLGFDRVQDIAYEYMASVAAEITDKNPSSPEEMRRMINEGEVLLSELVPPTVKRLSEVTRFADFARALVHMVYEDTNLYAWQWITGEGIRYEQRKEMEIHTALDDNTMGVRAFTAMKNALLDLEYTAVFVLIDEFESISRLSSKKEQSTLNSIRHLMDQNSDGLCVLFGCAPEIWQEVMSEYHAFSERIGEEVSLRPLTDEDVYKLVEEYLMTERENSEGISPFTSEGLELLLNRSQGNIRQILSLCSRVLDKATMEDVDTIDSDFVKKHLTRCD
jgi:Cdc6-like AAA superfamily ATPase